MSARRFALLTPLLALAACGNSPEQASTAAARPDLALCEAFAPIEGAERFRTAPLSFPAGLADMVVTDMDHVAVTTLGGGTLCLDARWMEGIEAVGLSPDERFLGFDWWGYELYGHQLIDRTGRGQAIDTGVPPVPSPSGSRLAALDYSESGFGELNAFAIWDVGPAGLTEAAKLEALPPLTDWRIDRWVGEDCLELSAIAWEDLPEDPNATETAPRDVYVARQSHGAWEIRADLGRGCAGA